MHELKYLDLSKITEDEAINLIVKHFPILIQVYVQTTKKQFLSIWKKFGKIQNPKQNKEYSVETKCNFNGIPNHNHMRSSQLNNSFRPNINEPQERIYVKQITVEQNDTEEEISILDEKQKKLESGNCGHVLDTVINITRTTVLN